MLNFELFFEELDRKSKGIQEKKIPLQIIGSSAIMIQTGYRRGTKDSDVLKTSAISDDIKTKLIQIGGQDSDLCKKHRVYLDIVNLSIPFLPQKPIFHPIPSLKKLKNIEVRALDLTDIVVSKLKRFNANDVSDIREIILQGKISHRLLTKRFGEAVDYFSTDARAVDLPKYLKNLNTVERDFLHVPESVIEMPHWI